MTGTQRMLSHAVVGLVAPANPSTTGSHQGQSQARWPTPRVSDIADSRPNVEQSPTGAFLKWISPTKNIQANLSDSVQLLQVKCWGTPTARDHKSGRGNEEREYKELTPMVERSQAGKLNPRWVETLMGLPVGWTMPSGASPVTIEPMNCDCLETELSPPPQNEHSELF